MRIGPWVIMREHPSEKALRKWAQLTPELREVVARATRSIAKDAVQDVMEAQGLAYHADPDLSDRSGHISDLIAVDAVSPYPSRIEYKHHSCYNAACPLGDDKPSAPADLAHANPMDLNRWYGKYAKCPGGLDPKLCSEGDCGCFDE